MCETAKALNLVSLALRTGRQTINSAPCFLKGTASLLREKYADLHRTLVLLMDAVDTQQLARHSLMSSVFCVALSMELAPLLRAQIQLCYRC
jgi:hypothetical protein